MQSFDATEYQGKRVEFRASLMCEDCDGATTLWLRADSIGADNGPIADTTDWTRRSIVLDNPEEAISISFGFYFRSRGAGYAVSAAPSNDHNKPVNLTLRLVR